MIEYYILTMLVKRMKAIEYEGIHPWPLK